MSEGFSAGGAAFEIFRRRERGLVLIGAAAGYVIGVIVLFAVMGALAWGRLAALGQSYLGLMQAAMSGDQISDPSDPRFAAFLQSYYGVAPLFLLYMLLAFILLAAYEAAVQRWLVRGETAAGLFGLNLGGDTWRVYFSYWIWFLLTIGLCLASVIASLIVGGALGYAFSNTQAPVAVGAGLGVLIVLIVAFAILYVVVRLAPAAATSVGRKKFAFFDAWRVTEGRFWSMLGAYLILFVLYFLAVSVLSGVLMGVAFGPMFAAVSQGAPADPSTLLATFTPTVLATIGVVYLAIGLIAMIFQMALMGVSARAVRAALDEGRIEAPLAA